MKKYILSKPVTPNTVFRCFIAGGLILLAGILSSNVQAQEREHITLRITVVNPSEEKTQKIPVKADLPSEVVPKNIIDKQDFELKYNDQKKIFYLYKEVEIAPKEIKVFKIKVKDLWFIRQNILDSLKSELEQALKSLDGTRFYESGQQLAQTINEALDVIVKTQDDSTLSGHKHIKLYRNNVKIAEQVKADIQKIVEQGKLIALNPEAAKPLPEKSEEKKPAPELKPETETKPESNPTPET